MRQGAKDSPAARAPIGWQREAYTIDNASTEGEAMKQGKPGRVLFWVSIASFALSLLLGVIVQGAPRDSNGAVLSALLLFVGIGAAVMWLRVKWTQTKARAARAGWDAVARK